MFRFCAGESCEQWVMQGLQNDIMHYITWEKRVSNVWAVLGLLSLSCNQIYCISILLVKDTVLSGVEFQAMVIS